ncbi:Uncharacterised protein [Mycobacteroides abscessus subsp. abscessus]|nr:Uncharacterised protein [Mycobacteroides abscessus subsp. abscessus]
MGSWASGSLGESPATSVTEPGPSPRDSPPPRWALRSGATSAAVSGGRLSGITPVAYPAAQASTFCA